MRRVQKELGLVLGSALLTLSSVSLLCCPTARAGSPAASQPPASSVPSSSPPDNEDSLDDDRAEHWEVPGIAREGRVQSEALLVSLIGAGAFGVRRRLLLKGQKRRG